MNPDYQINEQKNPNGSVTYRLSLGKNPTTGKRDRKNFKTLKEAEEFRESLKVDPETTGVLYANRNELGYLIDKLKPYGATLHQAVDFFLKHSVLNHKITLGGALEKYVTEKKQENLNVTYVENVERLIKTFGVFVNNSVVDVITTDQVRDFIYVERSKMKAGTLIGNLRDLSIFFRWCIDKGYCSFNPVTKVKRPQKTGEVPAVLTADEMSAILKKCYDKEWYDRLAMHLLVAFCGYRVEEASKLEWSDIDLDKKIVALSGDRAKKKRHRYNDIPENALTWFRLIEDKRRTGPIIGPNWKISMRATVSDCQNYKKNCIRHSFCSNALVWYGEENLNKVIAIMGHSPGDAQTIWDHYRNIRTKEEANDWFNILPK